MKTKSLIFILITAIILTIVPVQAEEPIKVKVNGQLVKFDVPPISIQGRTMVPVRAIFEAMGATVDWDPETKTVIGKRGAMTILLPLDSYNAKINYLTVKLDVPATSKNNRTLVPTRFIAESMGADVTWDSKTRTVVITADLKDNSLKPYTALTTSNEYDYILRAINTYDKNMEGLAQYYESYAGFKIINENGDFNISTVQDFDNAKLNLIKNAAAFETFKNEFTHMTKDFENALKMAPKIDEMEVSTAIKAVNAIISQNEAMNTAYCEAIQLWRAVFAIAQDMEKLSKQLDDIYKKMGNLAPGTAEYKKLEKQYHELYDQYDKLERVAESLNIKAAEHYDKARGYAYNLDESYTTLENIILKSMTATQDNLLYAYNQNRRYAFVKFLQAGVNPNGVTYYGRSLIDEMIIKDDLELLTALLVAGADPNGAKIDSNNEYTYLAKAYMYKKSDGNGTALAIALLKYGAKPDVIISGGSSLISQAVIKGEKELVKALIEAGADLQAPGRLGDTPLDLAEYYKQQEIYDMLVKAGAKK